jgi:hypothetical protein
MEPKFIAYFCNYYYYVIKQMNLFNNFYINKAKKLYSDSFASIVNLFRVKMLSNYRSRIKKVLIFSIVFILLLDLILIMCWTIDLKDINCKLLDKYKSIPKINI